MAMKYNIRPVEKSDRSAWNELWQGYLRFYESELPESSTERLWQRLLNSDHAFRCLVAEDSRTRNLIGFVQFFPHPDTWEIEQVCYLQDLFVDKNFRGNGIGATLIEAVVEESRRSN